jgi:hypothetical protein
MLEPELVPLPKRRAENHRGVASRLQHGQTTQLTGIPDADRVRGATGPSPCASRLLHSAEPNRGLG